MSAQLMQIQQFCHEDDLKLFAQDVLSGLSKEKKSIPSKYLYDAQGGTLFNLITKHPDYYLTQCDLEIIENNKEIISKLLNESFNLIELGPGEGIKTGLLIDQFMQDNHDFGYFTIDISEKFLSQIVHKFNQKEMNLKLVALNADFINGLKWLIQNSQKRNFVMLLGSSIGNLDPDETRLFLKNIWNDLQDGDYFFIGFDLRKKIELMVQAYNDSSGLTRQFNLNLLNRINKELGGNFDITHFEHYEPYNADVGAMESFLISTKEQDVYVDSLGKSFHFDAYEAIHIEYSYKYTLNQIQDYAIKNGFKIEHNFFDEKHYFVNSLWRVVKD